MGSHDLGYLIHKLWPKEKLGVKLSIWFPTIKSWESPWFTCVQVACHIPLKSFRWGLQLCLKSYPNWRCAQKGCAFPKCQETQFWEFRDSQLGNPRVKWHLNVTPVAKHKEYCKGEGGGFPHVWAMVNFMSLCMLVVRSCIKNAPTTH
jgi:hypothetical protein